MAVEGWIAQELGKIVCFEYGKPLPEKDRIDGPFPVFGSNGIVGKHVESYVEGPGIIVGRKGTAGSVLWSDKNFWPIDTTYFIKSLSHSDLKYLYYLLISLNLSQLSSTT